MAGRRCAVWWLRSCADVWEGWSSLLALPPHQSSGSSENAQPRRPAPHFASTHDMARDIELIKICYS